MKFKLLRFIIMTFKFSTYVFALQALVMVNLMAYDSNAQYKSVKKAEIEVEFTENSLSEVFAEIQEKTSYKFYYNKADLKKGVKVDMQPGSYMVSEILMKVSEKAGLKFRQVNNSIAVSKMTAIEKASEKPIHVIIEEVTISGKVTDQNGEGLPGASVVVKESGKGTVTDIDGNYTIRAEDDATLVFSYVGYETYEVSISGRSAIDATLVEDLETLQEVVINGYVTRSKTQSTAAASKIESRSLERQVTTNLDDKLEGLAPGLTLNTVTPDGGQERLELVLRGISTFDEQGGTTDPTVAARNALNRQPLIVVDGFPYEGPFNDIDASTIKSIDVLRDAAATTMWGARASNGVIVISTKRGQAGRTRISFSTNTTIGTKQNLNDFGLANSEQTLKILNQQQILEPNSFSSPVGDVSNPYDWMGDFDRSAGYRNINSFEDIWVRFNQGAITEAQRDAELASLGQSNRLLSDFEDHLLRGGLMTQNSLNVSGGSVGMLYSFTTTHTKEQSPIVGDDFERLNVSLTTDFAVSERFSVIMDVAVANSIKKDNGIGVTRLYTGQNGLYPFMSLVDANGNPTPVYDIYSDYKDQFLADGFGDPAYNPITDQKNLDNTTETFNIRLAGGVKYQFTDWLSMDARYQHNRIETLTNNHKSASVWSQIRSNNSFITGVDTGNGVTRAVPYGGSLERGTDLTVNDVFRGSLNFDKIIADDHTVSAIAGIEFSQNGYTRNKQQFEGYDDATGIYATTFDPNQFGQYGQIPGSVLGGSYTNRNLFENEIISRSVSTFANIAYSYKNRYNFEASGKIDQNNTIGLNERLKRPLLYALGASWNVSNEDFFDVPFLSEVKLRYSYGKNGNLRRGLSTQTIIGFGGSDWVTNVPYATIRQAGNPNLAFEKTIQHNIGIDFRLFDKVSASIDLYDKHSSDLLTPTNVNSSLGLNQGFDKVYTNNGEISNKGIEVALNADVLRNADFYWNVVVNYSYNKNRVISFGDEAETNGSSYYFDVSGGRRKVIGADVSSEVRYDWGGLNDNGDPQIYNDNGELIGWDTPDDLWPSQAGMVVTQPFNAPHTGALTSIFNYKNFSLSFMINYKGGHVFQETLRNKYPYTGGNFSHGFHEDVANAWENPGDENITDIPAIPRTAGSWFAPGETDYNRRSMFELSNYAMHDASHIRLRDITFNYTFGKFVQAVGVESAVFTFQMRNLALLWAANDEGLDPESVPFSGREITFNDNFPQAYRPGIRVPTSYVLGLKLNF